MSRCVVTVGTKPHFAANVARLTKAVTMYEKNMMSWTEHYPSGSPTHEQMPYAFKVYAILSALKAGYEQVLWLDSSVIPIRLLDPIWAIIDKQGYWISRNHPSPRHTCGHWTADEALPLLGITREEAHLIPQVAATAWGLDFTSDIASKFFWELLKLAENGSFRGDWATHRHDQTAMSVLVWRMKMHLTEQPDYFSDAYGENENTILVVDR